MGAPPLTFAKEPKTNAGEGPKKNGVPRMYFANKARPTAVPGASPRTYPRKPKQKRLGRKTSSKHVSLIPSLSDSDELEFQTNIFRSCAQLFFIVYYKIRASLSRIFVHSRGDWEVIGDVFRGDWEVIGGDWR